ncbi:hypothetical protein CC86DRAFT_433948 [Ophiobolus disseminans]|uniref:Uncharacterized protein n=1 Tax=Ophiobolus disseminans TaxID=1469910 RepID=A0A6A7AAV3_9PLEO|nr:hypothetical protein CC86DRAFT_433948 [Ophiobolus disseminans]
MSTGQSANNRPPQPPRGGRKLRRRKNGNRDNVPDQSEYGNSDDDSNNGGRDDPAEDESPSTGGGLEAQLARLRKTLGATERAASIPNFDQYLQQRAEELYTVPRPPNGQRRMALINKAVGGADNFKPKERRDKHDARKKATGMYEDFLYYQTPERRKNYKEHLLEEDRRKKRKTFRDGQAPGLLWCDVGNEARLRTMFESYERDNVGMIEELAVMGPEELHMRVPRARRTRVGLGKPNPPIDLKPMNLNLDTKAIERKRKAIEDTRKETFNDPQPKEEPEETHSERRAREVGTFGRLPTEHYVNSVMPTARDLRRSRQQSGLFLSAAETSYDWNVSYDQLDIIKTGVRPVEPHMIKQLKPLPQNSEEEPTQLEVQMDMKKLEHNNPIDGFLNEFKEPVRPHRTFALFPTTKWAETAYGRREREHAYKDLRPVSPVISPPHSPRGNVPADDEWLDIPVDITRDSAIFKAYQKKFKDPYCMRNRAWPHFKGREQGKGYEVPYEPLDVSALPEKQQLRFREKEGLFDERGWLTLPAPEGTSMRWLREALGEPYRAPEMSESAGPHEDEGSDDEGDLFRQSYLEGSCTQSGSGGGSGNILSVAGGPLQSDLDR